MYSKECYCPGCFRSNSFKASLFWRCSFACWRIWNMALTTPPAAVPASKIKIMVISSKSLRFLLRIDGLRFVSITPNRLGYAKLQNRYSTVSICLEMINELQLATTETLHSKSFYYPLEEQVKPKSKASGPFILIY